MRYILCFCFFFVASCAALPAYAMTLEEFQSRCDMGLQMNNQEECEDKDEICIAYMDAMAQTNDKADCKKSCWDTDAALRPNHVADNCINMIEHAYDECTIYCETIDE